jgi:hypothetical protein
MTDEQIATLTPETKAAGISGRKWVLVSEETMILSLSTCKVWTLLIYRLLMYVSFFLRESAKAGWLTILQ